MTNDQFTEWLTNRFLFYRRRKNDLLLSEKERTQAEAKETECADCIYQYRQLAPTWIPVTPETMPTKGEHVLVHGHYRIYNLPAFRTSALYHEDGYFVSHALVMEVTHWMPLPTPPIK